MPKKPCPNIVVADNGRGYHYILSNGTGYLFLTDVSALATSLGKNEIIYLPLGFLHTNLYANDFLKENRCTGIVIFNFVTTQIGAKDIVNAYISFRKMARALGGSA